MRRFSGLSMKSTVSAVVEAVLVDPQVPQRRRTLRHVKKHKTLRDSNPREEYRNHQAGSLTAESLKAHNALMESQTLKLALKKAESNQDVKIHQTGPGSEVAVMEEKPQAVDPRKWTPSNRLHSRNPIWHDPAAERQVLLGNYFEEMEKKPKRSISLVRRALSRRRYSESAASSPLRPGFLVRSLSLSKAVRKVTEPNSSVAGKNQNEAEPMYPTEECPPANEHMLHPFWRPYSDDGSDDEEDRSYDGHPDDEEPYERIFRYPPIDNRPRRSFSQRLKKTFAVLPVQEPQSRISHAARNFDTDRRTIGRTASGNLRVIRRRGSLDSTIAPFLLARTLSD
ncbi:unnamed protein product [Parascedosporium putredinis]|uniref:Uncharacterized protein n=1 Tax=Parascedosporium putredinis TaxID=1442378 RepID=A0A9P1H4E6_9PEZI|nr:unnamed protein product [Parascedosporium putredinis]CAI7995563.1 unnamed protein product [Parascedosporium putredinis]